ncbi:MAG: hypothetical protein R3205_11270, partial [Psychrobacter sp.]|nr:hypothetical protein [Psychrobacter sp.]
GREFEMLRDPATGQAVITKALSVSSPVWREIASPRNEPNKLMRSRNTSLFIVILNLLVKLVGEIVLIG